MCCIYFSIPHTLGKFTRNNYFFLKVASVAVVFPKVKQNFALPRTTCGLKLSGLRNPDSNLSQEKSKFFSILVSAVVILSLSVQCFQPLLPDYAYKDKTISKVTLPL